MRIVRGVALALIAIVVSGVVAAMAAIAMAETGMLGSCFEGSCAYIAIYAAFPLLWILLSCGSLIGYFIWRRRRA